MFGRVIGFLAKYLTKHINTIRTIGGAAVSAAAISAARIVAVKVAEIDPRTPSRIIISNLIGKTAVEVMELLDPNSKDKSGDACIS